MASVISGPCETVFLASLVTRPQGDAYSVIPRSALARLAALVTRPQGWGNLPSAG